MKGKDADEELNAAKRQARTSSLRTSAENAEVQVATEPGAVATASEAVSSELSTGSKQKANNADDEMNAAKSRVRNSGLQMASDGAPAAATNPGVVSVAGSSSTKQATEQSGLQLASAAVESESIDSEEDKKPGVVASSQTSAAERAKMRGSNRRTNRASEASALSDTSSNAKRDSNSKSSKNREKGSARNSKGASNSAPALSPGAQYESGKQHPKNGLQLAPGNHNSGSVATMDDQAVAPESDKSKMENRGLKDDNVDGGQIVDSMEIEETDRNKMPNIGPSSRDLAVAIAVEEDDEDDDEDPENPNQHIDPNMVVAAVELDDVEAQKGVRGWFARNRKLTLFFAVAVAAAVIASSIVAAGNNSDPPSPEEEAAAAQNEVFNSGSPRFQAAEILLEASGVSSRADLLTVDTPQFLAVDWIANSDGRELDFEATDINVVVQRFALAVLYFATNGDNWTESLNFLTESNECEWQQVNATNALGVVSCDDSNLVTSLNMDSNNLSGWIPSEIGSLVELQSLDLSCTQGGSLVEKSMPETFGNLINMSVLRIEDCNLGGTIPATIGGAISLTQLLIGGNNITDSIPETIGDLQGLEILRADNNILSGTLPTEIGLLQSLTELDLRSNAITGEIPVAISDIAGLEIIDFSANNLIGSGSPLCGLDLQVYRVDCYTQLVPAIPLEVGK